MIERKEPRDTDLDIAEIGAQVRAQLESLAAQSTNDMVRGWLAELKNNPMRIKENYRQIFLFMRGRGDLDETMEQKLAAWGERLAGINS